MFDALINSARNTAREISEMERLFQAENSKIRKLVFYAESGIFYRYYEDYIEHILANSDLDICYISSDTDDAIFNCKNKRIKPFYIKNSLPAAIARLDSKVLVMATPDLGKALIKRAPAPVHHVYVFRAISSIHQQYRLGAFDEYDSVLCVGDYQIAELRKSEEIYGTRKKELVLTGHPILERVYRQHSQHLETAKQKTNEELICLVAPTWDPNSKSSLLDLYIDDLIASLSKSNYEIWLRPHPEYLKRFPKKVDAIRKSISKHKNISLQLEVSSMACLYQADFLITEHSGISVDFALGTERQVLFVDTPARIDNPEFGKLGMDPVENTYRSKLGTRLATNDLNKLGSTLDHLSQNREEFRQTIPAVRDELVANWQKAASIGAEHIIDLAQRP